MNMTYHCEVERKDRVQNIIEHVGLGQVVKEKFVRFSGQAGRYVCLTDTGVTIIKSEDKQIIITMYITTRKELLQVYGNAKKIPAYLHKKVSYNQTRYVSRGRTIWD